MRPEKMSSTKNALKNLAIEGSASIGLLGAMGRWVIGRWAIGRWAFSRWAFVDRCFKGRFVALPCLVHGSAIGASQLLEFKRRYNGAKLGR